MLWSAILCSIWVAAINAQLLFDATKSIGEDSGDIATTFPPRLVPMRSNGPRGYYDKCGVKGPRYGRSTGKDPAFISNQVSNLPLDEITKRDQNGTAEEGTVTKSGIIDPSAAIESLEWAVPTLNDTVFAEYAGEHSPFSSRITYGEQAGSREFPWQVAITLYGRFHCGASLISDTYVLTAAHCVYLYAHVPSLLKLSLGDWDLKSPSDGQSVKANVSRVSVYPGYSRKQLINDIAVMKLTERVEFTDRIRPICLPSYDMFIDGGEAIVSGWGRNEAKQLETKLHFLRAKVLSNDICGERWTGLIKASMMCMDSTNGDACNADSGGPSVYESPAGPGNYVQVGIVSFGSGSCTDANFPGVYTRVGYYRDWIRQQMY